MHRPPVLSCLFQMDSGSISVGRIIEKNYKLTSRKTTACVVEAALYLKKITLVFLHFF